MRETPPQHADASSSESESRLGTLVSPGQALNESLELVHPQADLKPSPELFSGIFSAAKDAMGYEALDGSIAEVNEAYASLTGYSRQELMSLGKFHEITPREYQELELSIRKRLLEDGQSVEYEKEYFRKDGARIPVSLSLFLVRAPGGEPAGFAGIVRDLSKQKRAEATVRREQSLLRMLEAAAVASNEASSVDEAVRLCMDAICEYTGWEVGHAYVLKAPAPRLQSTQIWHFSDPARFAEFQRVTEANHTFLEEGLPGRAVHAGKGILVAHLAGDVRFTRTSAARDAGLQSAFAFPVLTGKNIAAVMELFSCDAMEADEALFKALENVGTQLGRVFERAQGQNALRRLSAHVLRSEDEARRRIARELHDSAGQYLVALQMNLGIMQRQASGMGGQFSEMMKETTELAAQCSAEIRTLSYLLHPPALEYGGLAAALKSYVEGFSKRSGIVVAIEVPEGLGRLPEHVELCVVRLVQEAFTNIHRHAESPTAALVISADAEAITIEISDEGKGIDQELSQQSSFAPKIGVGIAGMRERVREMGGQLTFLPKEKGTLLHARIPLHN
jgi:PAS domain S-box-containing protein